MTVTADDIRATLIDPLGALGWPRAKGVSAKAQRSGEALLCERLRYLSPEALSMIAEEALVLSQDRRAGLAAGEVLGIAHRAYPDPDVASQRNAAIARWMRSEPGQRAAREDYAVEMLSALRRVGPGFTYGTVLATRWKAQADDRRAMRRRAIEEGDTETAARIDAQVAEAEAMAQGESA